MAGRKIETLSPEEIRERVDQVMSRWQTYPDFAHLFDALLRANGVSEREITQDYIRATGERISTSLVDSLQRGAHHPSYAFVSNIANHALLNLDSERLRPATGSIPAGDYRLALFTAAGLIEVTPDSISHWNQEVLAAWQRRLEHSQGGPRPTWGDLMSKLLAFHSQGGRRINQDFADAANALLAPTIPLAEERIGAFLTGRARPSAEERHALERVAGLNPEQMNLIETAVEDDRLSLTRTPLRSAFSRQLADLLASLRMAGISQSQLCRYTAAPGETVPELSEGTLSAWKLGKASPTQAFLRLLVGALERCHDRSGHRLVSPEAIRSLVGSAGFSEFDLTATSHDIIARIDASTRLKPLLSALRNAADVNAPRTAVLGVPAEGDPNGSLSYRPTLGAWERDASPHSPTPSQVHDLLTRYNHLLREKGQTELSPEEIERVIEVVRRDREDGLERGFSKRVQESHPTTGRRTITPDLDDTPRR